MLANTTRTLTEAQREQWAVDGYLQLEGALSPAEVKFFSDLLDGVRGKPGYEPAATELQRGHYARKLPDQNLDAFMDRRDLLPYHQAFIDLIDRPRIFDLILDLMGPFIQFSMSQAIIRASTDTFPGYIHTDGGEAHLKRSMETVAIPVFQFGIFSDVDLSFHAGPNFNFGGRIHTNGNLYLAQGGGAGEPINDVNDYLRIANTLAANPEQLNTQRLGMREHLKNSPLMDGKRFTRAFETALRDVWCHWCDQKKAA